MKLTYSEPKELQKAFGVLNELVDEANINITKDGIKIATVDRSMVCFVEFELKPSAFDEYELKEDRKIGLNLSNLVNVLKRANTDKLEITASDTNVKFSFLGEQRREFEIPILELSDEELPPIKTLEFKDKVSIKSEMLNTAITDAETLTETLLISTENETLKFSADGEVSKFTMPIEKGNSGLLEFQNGGNCSSRYPIEYLKKIIKARTLSETVGIEFANDYPARFEFALGDKMRMSFIIAPRISE